MSKTMRVLTRLTNEQALAISDKWRALETCRDCKRHMASIHFSCPYCRSVKHLSKKDKKRFAKPFVKPTPIKKIKLGIKYQSATDPRVFYSVYVTGDNLFVRCTCPGFRFRQTCKHKALWNQPNRGIK